MFGCFGNFRITGDREILLLRLNFIIPIVEAHVAAIGMLRAKCNPGKASEAILNLTIRCDCSCVVVACRRKR